MSKKLKKLRMRIFISLAIFIIAIIVSTQIESEILSLSIYLVSYFTIGYDVIKKAVKNLLNGQMLDENFLMTLATVGAFVTGEYPEGVMVMWLYQVGECFQQYAVGKSRNSIANLMDIRPDYANIEKNGEIIKVDPEEIKIGDIIIVKPGEKVPLDGIVEEGESYLDTVALTGESVPRKVKIADEIFNGCINQNGILKIKVTKEYSESTVAKILKLVENASERKAKTENFISKFAKYYTPIVVVFAVLLACVPPLFIDGADWLEYIHRACSFLVISCPCALVISVPLGFFGGIGGASKLGILMKGSNYLEALSKVKTIVTDKTGTLTKGVFEVTKVVIEDENANLGNINEKAFERTNSSAINEKPFEKANLCNANEKALERTNSYATNEKSFEKANLGNATKEAFENLEKAKLIEVAALAEAYSEHPIALSIKKAYGKDIKFDRVSDVEEIAGKGIKAKIDGKEVYVGNSALMKENEIEVEEINDIGTIVYVAMKKEQIGYLLISDEIKEEVPEAINELKEKNDVEKIIMLTGDNEIIAKQIAEKISIDEVCAELLPNEKVEQMERILKEKNGNIAYVGDGLNDAPVLTRADVGIAMGGLGSDAAIEAADIVIMDDNFSKINVAISLAKRTIKIVKQNIVFALAVKAMVLILGAFGYTNMWQAVFADVGVSFIAIMNSMRAMHVKGIYINLK